MHVVMDNLKLGEIKGCDGSNDEGYPVKGAHNEGNGKSYFFLLLKGFEVRLRGV